MTRERRIAMLKAIYRTLPKVECRGLCQECCGPVAMTRLERDRVERHLGDKPKLQSLQRCPVLSDAGRCLAYDVRPLSCRLWGVVDNPKMRCPHGCVPERWLTDKEASDFLNAVRVLGGEVVMFGLSEDQTEQVMRRLKSNREFEERSLQVQEKGMAP